MLTASLTLCKTDKDISKERRKNIGTEKQQRQQHVEEREIRFLCPPPHALNMGDSITCPTPFGCVPLSRLMTQSLFAQLSVNCLGRYFITTNRIWLEITMHTNKPNNHAIQALKFQIFF